MRSIVPGPRLGIQNKQLSYNFFGVSLSLFHMQTFGFELPKQGVNPKYTFKTRIANETHIKQ